MSSSSPNQKNFLPPSQLIVVVGDIHSRIQEAFNALEKIELQFQRSIAQVFCVGDLGLFLDPGDWKFLTGPKRYRRPQDTPAIRAAWEAWRWPLATIAGNHEPFNRLRNFNPAWFAHKLTYTNAGMLSHSISGLRVAGLSGIFHLEDFGDLRQFQPSIPDHWAFLLDRVAQNKSSPKTLTRYRFFEVIKMLGLASPHLLLTHDWPVRPDFIEKDRDIYPELSVTVALRPQFHLCGHHHVCHSFLVDNVKVRALSILKSDEASFTGPVNSGWAWLAEWNPDTQSLTEFGYWPKPVIHPKKEQT
jgi:hypothetical protein